MISPQVPEWNDIGERYIIQACQNEVTNEALRREFTKRLADLHKSKDNKKT